MEWAKLHTRYYSDPKIAALDDSAEVMFVRSLAFSGERETGGFVPEAVVPGLARSRRHAKSVSALIASRLWTATDGGYQITRWHDWQEELELLAARRAADRERKRRERARKNSQVTPQSRDVSTDSHVTVRALEKEEEKYPPNPPQAGGHDGSHPNCRQCGTNPRGPSPPEPPSDAARHPSARPPAEAEQAAGLQPRRKPARGDTVTRLAAQARAAIHQEDR
ncbi:MAG TPA: hypothetical protein VIV12_02425 [Streptosporangiaceae bacterium]